MIKKTVGGNAMNNDNTTPAGPSASTMISGIYNDPDFPALTIKEFSAKQLHIHPDHVIDKLFEALPEEKRTGANRALIEKGTALTVNASGAIMMMVNTNEGLQLICANSQRRKGVVQTNG